MIVHFPIALLIVAAAAECVGFATGEPRWRAVAIVNLRTGAAFAAAAAIAGWRLALAPGVDPTPLLEWHRWIGAIGAVAAVGAAAATCRTGRWPPAYLWTYRGALVGAATAIAAAGHLGGLMVWGVDFLRP